MFRVVIILFLWLATFATADEYYCIMFSHDTRIPRPDYSHVWGSFICMKNNKVDTEFTISWNPKGKWRALDGKVPGYNKRLRASIEDAVYDKKTPRDVCLWGPYPITKEFHDKAFARYNLLNKTFMYEALDTVGSRIDINKPATNCIHAISDIEPGLLKTGAKFGAGSTQAVVDYFMEKGCLKKYSITLSGERVIVELGIDKYKEIIRK